MRYAALMLTIISLCFTNLVKPTTINGRFNVISTDSLRLKVLLQINTNTGTDDLGGATLVFGFDTSAIDIPENPVYNLDYIFNNFSGGIYSPATLTRPMRDKIWVNIDLPYVNNNNGTIVTASPAWTNVVEIYFDIIDPNGNASLSWNSTSIFWGIYDADNTILWEVGQFEDLNGPLPVELTSFTASVNQNDVILKWQTATERNNSGFEILRKNLPFNHLQGGEEKGWVVIGFVQGQGTTTEENNYSFTDEDLERGNYSYKLSQVDYNGTRTESEIVKVEVGSFPEEYSLSQNYPNPFNPSTKIKFSLAPSLSLRERVSEGRVKVTLKVYDILGNEIATLVDEVKESGTYEVELNTLTGSSIRPDRNLPSGIYFYTLRADEFIQTKKMVLLR